MASTTYPARATVSDGLRADHSTDLPDVQRAAHQAFWLLRIAFTVAPILFGVDKFFNWTVHWPDYLAGWLNELQPIGTGQDFMYVVGAIEILAGLLVFRVEDPAQVRAFVDEDPYVANGLVTDWRVDPWNVVT